MVSRLRHIVKPKTDTTERHGPTLFQVNLIHLGSRLDIYKKAVTLSSMKNVLHFSQRVKVSAESVGRPAGSENGDYSYSYYLLPYSGGIVASISLSKIAHQLQKLHYVPVFSNIGEVTLLGQNETAEGGIILYSIIFHHDD